ncbi:hypothetical protein BD414DRAFT_503644 [Trametes punicea]|nr:hypothetical protein BD414DRAFT_503644 [Trametes punicea]
MCLSTPAQVTPTLILSVSIALALRALATPSRHLQNMPAPPFFAQQPRWLLLSVLLFLWSVSSGLRGDGRSRALGLGVDARAHMPVADNPVLEEVSREEPFTVMWKRQGGMPTCAAMCASQASDAVECGDSLNLGCACLSPSFLPDAVGCMDQNCTTLDERLGQMVLQSACQDIATTTAASTTSSGSSMLFSSGTPTVYPTASPTSASATTSVSVTVTVTVTVTLSPPGPPDCPSGAAFN